MSGPQGSHSRQLARRQSGTEPGRNHHTRALATIPDETPRKVYYEDESTNTYVVRASDARQVLVPKARNRAEPFPITGGYQVFATRLVRWSAFALIGVAIGGVGGIVLGLPVVIVAAVGLADHGRRVQRWRETRAGPDGVPPLPAAATTERLRLCTAFWQGLAALVCGSGVLVFLSGRVL